MTATRAHQCLLTCKERDQRNGIERERGVSARGYRPHRLSVVDLSADRIAREEQSVKLTNPSRQHLVTRVFIQRKTGMNTCFQN